MTLEELLGVGSELSGFLSEFSHCFGRTKPRRKMKVYSGGQVSDLPRKCVEPIARAAKMRPRTLQEFLASDLWDEDRLRKRTRGSAGWKLSWPSRPTSSLRRRRGKKYQPQPNTPQRPSRPDRRTVELRKHPGCGGEMTPNGDFTDRIVEDVPEPKVEVHRFRRHVCRCEECGKTAQGRSNL